MPSKIRQSKRVLFLLGMAGWLVLWTAYYAIAEAADPRPNLAAAIVRLLLAVAISLVVMALLLVMRLRWAVLGYLAAMALNGVGLLLLGGFWVVYFVISFPFFLPGNYRP